MNKLIDYLSDEPCVYEIRNLTDGELIATLETINTLKNQCAAIDELKINLYVEALNFELQTRGIKKKPLQTTKRKQQLKRGKI